MCGAHATVRGFLGELVARSVDTHDVVVDMEAGLEHLSRGTGRHLSCVLSVVEPYFRSMATARRIVELAAELGVARVEVVMNKIRDAADRQAIRTFCAAHGLTVAAEIPYDPALVQAERDGVAPVELGASSPAVQAIRGLEAALLGRPE